MTLLNEKQKWFVRRLRIHEELPEFGWGNGYVLIHPEHPFYSYHTIGSILNLEITYDKLLSLNTILFDYPEFYIKHSEYRVIGFDTIRYRGADKGQTKDELIEQTILMKNQVLSLGKEKHNILW